MLDPQTPTRLGDLRSVKDVAARVGLHPSVVHYYVDRGDLPVYRVGPLLLVLERDVVAFEASYADYIATPALRRPLVPRRKRGTPAGGRAA